MLEAMMGPRKQISKPKFHKPHHLLSPDRKTLDNYLARLLYFVNPQRYKVAATIELIPAWLRFLELRRLIDDQLREKTLFELERLNTDLLKVWRKYPADPSLQQGIKRWSDNIKMGRSN